MEDNSPSWCHEKSVYKVWAVLGSGVQNDVERHTLRVLYPVLLI